MLSHVFEYHILACLRQDLLTTRSKILWLAPVSADGRNQHRPDLIQTCLYIGKQTFVDLNTAEPRNDVITVLFRFGHVMTSRSQNQPCFGVQNSTITVSVWLEIGIQTNLVEQSFPQCLQA